MLVRIPQRPPMGRPMKPFRLPARHRGICPDDSRFFTIALAVPLFFIFIADGARAGTRPAGPVAVADGPEGGGSTVGSGGDEPLVPIAPGFPRSWERGIEVGTYTTVNVVNGNLATSIPIASWTGVGPELEFGLVHNSADGIWRHSYSRTLEEIESGAGMRLTMDDGREVSFTNVGGVWEAERGYFLELSYGGVPEGWRIKTKDQWVWVFEPTPGGGTAYRLSQIIDSSGNVMTMDYPSAAELLVTDASGRWLHYNATGVSPGAGTQIEIHDFQRQWTVTFEDATQTRIIGIEDPMDFDIGIGYWVNWTLFPFYSPGNQITSITDKAGNTFSYEYDFDHRCRRVIDPAGIADRSEQRFAYDPWPRTFYTPRRGAAARVVYDVSPNAYRVTTVYRPYGTERFRYDLDGNVTERIDGANNRWQWTYDANGNVLEATDPLNNTQEWEYDQYNNVQAYIDAGGVRTEFDYEHEAGVDCGPAQDNTLLCDIRLPEPETGVGPAEINLKYGFGSRAGLLTEVVDANGAPTVFTYDEFGQLSSEQEGVIGSGQVLVFHEFDPLGRHLRSARRGYAGSGPAPAASQAAMTGGSSYDGNGRMTANSCVNLAWPAPPPTPGVLETGAPDRLGLAHFGELESDSALDDYDNMGRLRHADTTIFHANTAAPEPDRTSEVFANYDSLGRATSRARSSNEQTRPPYDWMVPEGFVYTYDNLTGVSTRSSAMDGLATTTETDLQGRVTRVAGTTPEEPPPPPGDPPPDPPVVLFEANYTYAPGRDLVQSIVYGNGTRMDYDYDAAGRPWLIQHGVETGPAPGLFLQLVYTYDSRGRIESIVEQTDSELFTVDYVYDDWGRLTGETRTRTAPSVAVIYDLAYVYDAGGNRLTKLDTVTGRQTHYTYNPGNNRLLSYETVQTTGPEAGFVVERGEYEYDESGDAAGNIVRVIRKVPVSPGPDPTDFDVFATEFYYNKAGEVQVITQRAWTSHENEVPAVYADDQILAIKEVRGNGRTRYMLRDWDFSWNAGAQDWDVSPNNESATWTAYDGDLPAYDYVMELDEPNQEYDPAWQTSYHLGLAQRDAGGPTRYYHSDHLGTTRGMSDEGTVGPPPEPVTVSPRLGSRGNAAALDAPPPHSRASMGPRLGSRGNARR